MSPKTQKIGSVPIYFNRQEWAGAFGDLGTDFPLIVGMILAAGLDSTSVFVMFGAMQILTGFLYRMPMPVQPLKAMAAIVIAQKLTGNILYGAGLAIGLTMLLLTVTGLIDRIGRVVPKAVVRGIQFGLGLKLAALALKDYVSADGLNGYILAGTAFILVIFLLRNRKFPAAIGVILSGLAYAFIFKLDSHVLVSGTGLHIPQFHVPSRGDILAGFLLLAIPQIPLSLGNSLLATSQVSKDFFPERPIKLKKISWTYSLMNLVNPFFGGVPTCHGSGGMVGHYNLGARTGGSVLIYGTFYVVTGLFLGGAVHTIVQIFPLPMLGVLLFFEGLGLMILVRDLAASKPDLIVAILTGLIAGHVPYGFVIGILAGTGLFYLNQKGLTQLGRDQGHGL